MFNLLWFAGMHSHSPGHSQGDVGIEGGVGDTAVFRCAGQWCARHLLLWDVEHGVGIEWLQRWALLSCPSALLVDRPAKSAAHWLGKGPTTGMWRSKYCTNTYFVICSVFCYLYYCASASSLEWLWLILYFLLDLCITLLISVSAIFCTYHFLYSMIFISFSLFHSVFDQVILEEVKFSV